VSFLHAGRRVSLAILFGVVVLVGIALIAPALGGGVLTAFAVATGGMWAFLVLRSRRDARRLARADAAERARLLAEAEHDMETWGKAMAVLFLGTPAVILGGLAVWGLFKAISAL
jgi:hypothetical protein